MRVFTIYSTQSHSSISREKANQKITDAVDHIMISLFFPQSFQKPENIHSRHNQMLQLPQIVVESSTRYILGVQFNQFIQLRKDFVNATLFLKMML